MTKSRTKAESRKNDDFFRDALSAANDAADGASEILLNYFGNLKDVSEKDQAGLVSEADRDSEAFIVSRLKTSFPGHRFLGEESGLSSNLSAMDEKRRESLARSDALWIIDPLDGTTNYVHRFPLFCISIGLEVDGELVLGVVDAPKMGLRFHAILGHGAYLNGERISVSRRDQFREGLFATGFPLGASRLDEQFALIETCVREARGIRRAGSAALDLCFVAQGVFDVFWEANLQPWDMAAGAVIAREAGGVVTNFEGGRFTTMDRDILAGNPAMHAEFVKRMRQIRSRGQ